MKLEIKDTTLEVSLNGKVIRSEFFEDYATAYKALRVAEGTWTAVATAVGEAGGHAFLPSDDRS